MLLRDVVEALEADWPAALAEDWDAVGLVCGDPDAEVEHVHLAVDPTEQVVEEALRNGAQMLVTHHPLYLRGTTTVAATTPKGRALHALIRGGCGLLVAHTNADRAEGGVNDALADLFDLQDRVPLEPVAEPGLERLGVYVPLADAEHVLAALHDAGAGAIGAYDRCSWQTVGQGRFRPLPGAQPAVGEVGRDEVVPEARLEVVVPAGLRRAVLAAMRAAHPYEEVAHDLVAMAAEPGPLGLGRVGELPTPVAFAALVERAARVLPSTAWGVRGSGDADRLVSRLAVCGGAGDSLLHAAAEAGAEVFLTSDLRHHPAQEAPAGLALIDAAHWATESPWLPVAAERLRARTGVTTTVSRLVTDPFGLHARGPE